MIKDLAIEQPNITETVFDVCIAGGGVAGITIALRLAAAGKNVALLEAGGLMETEGSQDFYRGQNTGTENLLLHETRLRVLGGSSNHWGGWCRRREPYDFTRTDLTGVAWPISAPDLDPYFEEALAVLGVTTASGAELELNGSDGDLQTIRMYFSRPAARLGKRYRDRLETAANVTLVINAPVVSIDVDSQDGRVEAILVHGAAGSEIRCRARTFVLAMGAVENARNLLLWNRDYQNRLGNTGDMVGRYFMQHLHQKLGEFVLFEGARPPVTSEDVDQVYFAATRQCLESLRTGAFRLYSAAIGCTALRDEVNNLVVATACPTISSGGALFITAEQAPSPDSRVLVTGLADSMGRPRVELSWRLTESDVRTMREAAMVFGRYLIAAGLGRLKVNRDVLEGREPLRGWTALPSAPGAAGHQMGGCRMSTTPGDGVVDGNCLVWGTKNLYVAGSGVFRTGGEATPTLTIVQLALRLADRLQSILA